MVVLYESDQALVVRMRACESAAFDEFFHCNVPRLLALAGQLTRLDAASVEDIVQSTLVKALCHLSSYRAEASLFTWLSRICCHEVVDSERQAARRAVHISLEESDEVLQLRIPTQREPAAETEALICSAAVARVLSSLSERQAFALKAMYGDGLSVAEIAGVLGLKFLAAQSLLARGRESFRTRWTSDHRDHLR